MGFAQTILFYLVIGGGVAAALYLVPDGATAAERAFRTLTGIFFWPLYLPALLAAARPPETGKAFPARLTEDQMSAAIQQVERELDGALSSLEGWAEGVLAEEQPRLEELRSAWRLQAARIRELDELLGRPDFLTTGEGRDAVEPGAGDRLRHSARARQENVARLQDVRRQLHDDLMGTLAWVRELVTMIHLAKFTGAPASRAEELVSQVAAAVEGLSEAATWRGGTMARSA